MSTTRWTEVEAKRVFKAWRKSGASLHAFAKSRDLSPERLYRWRRRLGDPPDVKLVAVTVTGRPAEGEPVTIVLRSGHMLKLGRDFDEEAFRRAVKVLESC